jgi:hypothetical protein
MEYVLDEEACLNTQMGYGKFGFENLVDAVIRFNEGKVALDDLESREPLTLANIIGMAAILENGRRRLGKGWKGVEVAVGGKYGEDWLRKL